MDKLTGRDIHREWRDGMLAQGRTVSPQRMKWDSLEKQDKYLDDGIAIRLNNRMAPEVLQERSECDPKQTALSRARGEREKWDQHLDELLRIAGEDHLAKADAYDSVAQQINLEAWDGCETYRADVASEACVEYRKALKDEKARYENEFDKCEDLIKELKDEKAKALEAIGRIARGLQRHISGELLSTARKETEAAIKAYREGK